MKLVKLNNKLYYKKKMKYLRLRRRRDEHRLKLPTSSIFNPLKSNSSSLVKSTFYQSDNKMIQKQLT